MQSQHYASDQIRERLVEVERARAELEAAWVERRKILDQCLELQLFSRECEQADTWVRRRPRPKDVENAKICLQMSAREAFLAQDDASDNVESLIKKHVSFGREN